MKYMGSKSRLSKHIVPILNRFNDREFYIEPFVGEANIIDKVDFMYKIGYDKNIYLIELLAYVANGGKLPTTISEEEYYRVRDNKESFDLWYVGLVGFCASYGGRFFEGYPRGKKPNGEPRDYTNEAIRNIEKQRNNLKNITFVSCDYKDLSIKNKMCLVYCDPPYKGSKPYKTNLLGKFDSNIFWDWVRLESKYNPVIVSEYEAPNDFICVWAKKGDKK